MIASFAITGGVVSISVELSKITLKRNSSSLKTRNQPVISAVAKEIVSTKKAYNSMEYIVSPSEGTTIANDHVVSTLEHQQLQQLVQKIKTILASKSVGTCDTQELVMIDAIQRLGLECYFQDVIHAVIRKHYKSYATFKRRDNLYDAALRFRLLRQQGFNVPNDIFHKFTDKDGMFREELGKDIKGIINLFEASHVSLPGEHILDEGGEFSMKLLKSLKNVQRFEAKIIENILSNPYHKSLPRLTAKDFLHNFESWLMVVHDCDTNYTWISEVRTLASIDINMSQKSYQDEITQISRWWKELRLTDELKQARNQPAKWHMWSLASLPGPNLAEQRILLTKVFCLGYVIDDIYDVYGTLEELISFTEAVKRWDYAEVEGLPDYMKICLKALFDTTGDMSHKMCDKHGWNPTYSLQTAWADLCNAFLTELKWFALGHIPTPEEYLKNGILSTGFNNIIYASIFVLLGEGSSNNNCTDLLDNRPVIASLVATILRLWDDLGSAEDENQDGHDGSIIRSCMNEDEGCSTETAREHVITMISDAWKSLNEAYMSPFSTDFKLAFLNLARLVPIMYSYDHDHRLPLLEKHMTSLLLSEQTDHNVCITVLQ